MRNVVLLLIIAAAAHWAYGEYTGSKSMVIDASHLQRARPVPTAPTNFRCDGRTQCARMTSCEEALYFIQHCPNTAMDGDNDGVPCESQWCG